MVEIRKTQIFEDWFLSLRDRQARLRIQARIDRLMFANPGQHRMLTRGVCEMKIDYGPGYRVYFLRHGEAWVVLLCGGDKKSQRADIRMALAMVDELGDWYDPENHGLGFSPVPEDRSRHGCLSGDLFRGSA